MIVNATSEAVRLLNERAHQLGCPDCRAGHGTCSFGAHFATLGARPKNRGGK